MLFYAFLCFSILGNTLQSVPMLRQFFSLLCQRCAILVHFVPLLTVASLTRSQFYLLYSYALIRLSTGSWNPNQKHCKQFVVASCRSRDWVRQKYIAHSLLSPERGQTI